MKKDPDVKITTNGITETQIFVNGKEVEGVVGIRFSQTYKENNGLPILQIDLKATNVELDAKMLPALPEPFNHHYISVNQLLNSKILSKDEQKQLCRELGIELEGI